MLHRTSAAVAILAAAHVAHADIVDAHFTGMGSSLPIRLTTGANAFNSFAGQLRHEVTGAPEGWESLLGEQRFYCVDPFQLVSSATTPYTLTGLTDVPDSAPMSPAAARAVRSLLAGAERAGFDPFSPTLPSPYGAAFQIALWEVATDYDPDAGRASLDPASGWLRVQGRGNSPLNPVVRDTLSTLFDAVDEQLAYVGSVHALRSGTAQDQLFAVAGEPLSIPAPATLFLLGTTLAFARRRR
jgi:hypothetical protein